MKSYALTIASMYRKLSSDRRFIKAMGNTPVEYLQRVKVEAAKRSLEQGRKTIYEIMDEVGYADEKSFREVFR